MSISEAAIVLGTSTHSIRCQARAGKLEAREENGTLYVRLAGRHADGPPSSVSPAAGDPASPQRRAAERSRVWKGMITATCILVLGAVAGGLVYRVLEERHKQAVARMLDSNARANRELADKLEAQRLQSIALTRQLHEERANVQRSAENVARLSSQVEAASLRLGQLEKELARETTQREALVAQRLDLFEERTQLTEELAEMMKHLAVARKQLNESQHELAQARSRLSALQWHPQASPLPREMIEDFERYEPTPPAEKPPQDSPERIETSTGQTPRKESFSHLPHERRHPAGSQELSDHPRLITVVPDRSQKLASE